MTCAIEWSPHHTAEKLGFTVPELKGSSVKHIRETEEGSQSLMNKVVQSLYIMSLFVNF